MRPEILGFDWSNFVPTLWEILPWSFAIDYFTNIGDVLSAWSFPLSAITWAQSTLRNSHEFTVDGYGPTGHQQEDTIAYAYKLVQLSLDRAKGGLTYVRRESVDPFSMLPVLQVRLPGLGSLKWLNLAALASQRARLSPL
jgi:hypothetical protein